jgi:hypothetical protein
LSFLEGPQDKPGVIGDRIPALGTPFEAFGSDARRKKPELIVRVVSVIPSPRQEVVRGEEHGKRPFPGSSPFIVAKQKAQWIYEPGHFPKEPLPLSYRVPCEPPVP